MSTHFYTCRRQLNSNLQFPLDIRVMFGYTYLMYERVNDKIEVLVHFTLEKPVPLAIIWKGRKFKIQAINFVHISHEGKAKIMEFALSSVKEAFNVKFDLEECTWTLCEVFFEGFIKAKNFN